MGAFGWVVGIILILLVGFMMASSETQEKIIKNSPEIIGNILEKLQKASESNIIKINNVDYERVGKPIRTENVEYDCVIDDNCNSIVECNLDCKCSENYCWRQKV